MVSNTRTARTLFVLKKSKIWTQKLIMEAVRSWISDHVVRGTTDHWKQKNIQQNQYFVNALSARVRDTLHKSLKLALPPHLDFRLVNFSAILSMFWCRKLNYSRNYIKILPKPQHSNSSFVIPRPGDNATYKRTLNISNTINFESCT